MMKKIINYLKIDYNRRTYIFASISVLINFAFSIYNGVIGFVFNSIWHLSIFGYYLLLMFIKALLILGKNCNKNGKTNKQNIIIFISFIILIITTIAMIGPAVILVQNKRIYDWGLIPAIAMAAYTTYSITMAIININKVKANDDSIVKQIRLINMIAAIMSVLVLQNTLILASGEYSNDMKLLSIFTSIAIIMTIIIIVIYSLIKTVKKR